MQESCEKIARKLRETLLAKCRGTPKKLNKIKGFHDFAVTETRVFQDRLVMTASITLRKYDATACIIFTELKRCGSMSVALESASHTPPEDRQARLSGAGCGYSRRGEITSVMHTVLF